MSRITRNTRRLAQLDDDDDLVLRLSQFQSSHADQLKEDDDLDLFLSQTQNTQLNESAVSELASSTNNIQVNIACIEQVIKQNHGVFAKQHDVLLNLVSDTSVNVAEICDRVKKLEKRQCSMQKTINNNKDMLDEVTTDLEKVKKSIRIVKQKQSQSIKHDEFEERLKIVEAKLMKQEHNDQTSDSSNIDTVLYVRNLPYGMKDDDDARSLISDGLGLNSEIRSTHRAPSINYDAGVLTINLASPDEKLKVMANKWKLSNSEKYHDVYIAGEELLVNRRIERKFEMLIYNLHGRRSTPAAVYNRTYYNRNRYRQ